MDLLLQFDCCRTRTSHVTVDTVVTGTEQVSVLRDSVN
jgi:hypothetical protein